ncbi:MAG: response regulator [Phycisphaerae bacterium]|nr:response regulator [Phycisphaerae bacterium]
MAVIVIAEDELHIARVVSLWLTRNRHVVHVAHNGRDALDLVRQHDPDLLIADVNMPVMDGFELVDACAAEGRPKVGIIVLTSRCDQAEIGDRLKGHEVMLHPKPFSPSKLVGEVEEFLSGRQARSGAVSESEEGKANGVFSV